MDRFTKRKGGYIERVCHYIKNQNCYSCIDRAKCNADLFERLAMLEDMIEQGELVLKDGGSL